MLTDQPPADAPINGDSEQQLVQVANELVEAMQQGRPPDRAALLARFPRHSDRLERLIEAAEMVVGLRTSAQGVGSLSGLSDSVADHETPRQLGDFEILCELGKGGMGVVYEARQISLQRRVALKILPFASVLDPRQLQRFKNEALAAAQLNHPHIVDVYGVGCERGVHYYAMRLIEGESLAEAIDELRQLDPRTRETESDRPRAPQQPDAPARQESKLDASARGEVQGGSPTAQSPSLTRRVTMTSAGETPRLAALSTDRVRRRDFYHAIARLGIDAAEALHHAHEQGVIHRDVKPSNLMLDERGKVWVTDFGLAHVETGAGLTMSGELLGTLRYMSPEQASGQRLGVDHRTDVYSLGVTLYELLTLQCPFDAPTRPELLRQILFDEPRPLRKVRGDVPVDLETIVLKCLEKSAGDRYASAQEVAADLQRYVDDRDVAARRASLVRRCRKWGRRHRPLLATAGAAILVLTAAPSWLWWERDTERRQRRELVDRDLREATLLGAEARAKGNDLATWTEALAAARRAEAFASTGPTNSETRARAADAVLGLQRRIDEVRARQIAQQRDGSLLAALDDARLQRSFASGEYFDDEAGAGAYERAFAEYGITINAQTINDAKERIRASPLRVPLIEAIMEWSILATPADTSPHPGPQDLLTVASSACTDEPAWHRPLVSALLRRDSDALRAIVADAPAQQYSAPAFAVMVQVLAKQGDFDTALLLALHARQRFPGDFWANEWLADILGSIMPPDRDESVRFHTAAVALRPDSAGARLNLGLALKNRGDLMDATREYQRAIELDPNFAEAFNNLGNVLKEQGDIAGAIVQYRRAIVIKPELASAHNSLGNVLHGQGQLDEAMSEFRRAVELRPDFALAHFNLGVALKGSGDGDGAITEYRLATEFDPGFAGARINLGIVLAEGGDLDGAIAQYRQAIELEPESAPACINLGRALLVRGDLNGAIAAHRRAVEIKPNLAVAHLNLADAFKARGDLHEAAEEYRRTLDLSPESAAAHCNLADVLFNLGEFSDGLVAIRRGHELGSRDPSWSHPSAEWVRWAERLVELDATLANCMTSGYQPRDPPEQLELARFCLLYKHLFVRAAEWYRDGFILDASLATDMRSGHRYNATCAAALAATSPASGDLTDAERAAWREQAREWLAAELEALRTLARLPDAERQQWQALWSQVEQLRAELTPAPAASPY